MSNAEYLTAMHHALAATRGPFDAGGEDVARLLRAYDGYMKVVGNLTPPANLGHAHDEIVAACGAMQLLLSAVNEMAHADFDEIQAVSERGAAGFAILRAEARKLGLELSFR